MQLGGTDIIPTSQANNIRVSLADKLSVAYLQFIPSELHPIVSHDVDYQLAILLRTLNAFLEKQKLTADITIHIDSRICTE